MDSLVKKRTAIPAAAAMLIAVLAFFGGMGTAQGAAAGVADVKRDFNEICANSTDGERLEKEALQNLITRCDTLKLRIEGLDDTDRRYYLRRLKSCRDLYKFMLDTTEPEKPATAPPATAK